MGGHHASEQGVTIVGMPKLRQGFYDLKCGLHLLYEKNVVREQYACEPQQELSSAERMSCTQSIVTGAARSSLQPQTRDLAPDGLSGVFTLQPQTDQVSANLSAACGEQLRWWQPQPRPAPSFHQLAVLGPGSVVHHHSHWSMQKQHPQPRTTPLSKQPYERAPGMRDFRFDDAFTVSNHRRRTQPLGPKYFRYRTGKSRQTRILSQLRSALPY